MKKKLVTAIMLALGVGIGSAQAATIGQLTSAYPEFLWEDDDIEGMNIDLNQNGLLDVGDTLRGIVEITAIYDTSAGFNVQIADTEGLGRTDNHLAAIFETEVLTKTLNISGTWDYTFGAVGGGTGAILTFYESAVDNFTIFNCGASFAACEANVTDGTKILELGFAGDPDEFWNANGVLTDNPDVGLLEFQNLAFNFGDFNFGVSVLFSSIGTFLENQSTQAIEGGAADGNDLVQWIAGGTVKGTCTEDATADADNICEQHIASYGDYKATSDADLTAHAVPEPASLALLGLGLLGMGALRRRA